MLRQRTVAGDSVPISIKPAIAPPKDPIKAWKTEDCVERPCPPDSPCHVQVCVGARFRFSGARQYSYIIQQILLLNLQNAFGRSGLQVFNRKAPRFNCLLPVVNPTKAEPASSVVEYPTLARQRRFRFVVGQPHRIRSPLKTMTGEPSATNAESGRR